MLKVEEVGLLITRLDIALSGSVKYLALITSSEYRGRFNWLREWELHRKYVVLTELNRLVKINSKKGVTVSDNVEIIAIELDSYICSLENIALFVKNDKTFDIIFDLLIGIPHRLDDWLLLLCDSRVEQQNILYIIEG